MLCTVHDAIFFLVCWIANRFLSSHMRPSGCMHPNFTKKAAVTFLFVMKHIDLRMTRHLQIRFELATFS
jgi:hypothetical protein